MSNKTVTREDVARLANVSPTIVSYVLNNSNYVSKEKREQVLKAVKELNYIPNQLARGLRTSRSSQFIFVCDNIQAELFEAVESRLFEHGYYVSLNYSRNTEEFLNMLVSRQPEGIFMATNVFEAQQLNGIAESGIPIILYKTKKYEDLNPRIVTVVPDYYDAVKKSMDYLILKGHKRIGLIPPVKYMTKGITGNDFRVKAYVEALEGNGIPVHPELVCTRTQTLEDIYEEVFRMVVSSGKDKKPTALVIGNDYLAAQIMQYLKKLNIRVPDDLSIIGCDNTQIAPLMAPALTTVDVSKDRLAESYVEKMLAMIEGKAVEEEFVGVKLIIRESA
ncbi:LacI family DNA-binding transcriptional regulator [Lacrimispora sp.]|uniref:LacI family DNA-binding transcriptional regulator n=1 Tax=Lacrimispora sp. TaxID=2719234 RepID=UPI002FDAAF59